MTENEAHDNGRHNDANGGRNSEGDDGDTPLRFFWVHGFPHFRGGIRQLAAILEAQANWTAAAAVNGAVREEGALRGVFLHLYRALDARLFRHTRATDAHVAGTAASGLATASACDHEAAGSRLRHCWRAKDLSQVKAKHKGCRAEAEIPCHKYHKSCCAL
eukprot:CAMPEP_0177441410 /NCGR_PEP_ID=MMETSP0369-20130122/4391_1 /TAXON_ID=447022 ORGANISM="Scrippsiella hangoei-like, Strain SHHI-4" /NCGR_SAMPLE_ID=MMETSP0369 /ASSEMBLY_ACC=CAM_ASM_000364 /LENGTH=160 /DNA_ID=CAMNT_0018913277 /DNA_START=579 /DNA_END=1060 /DNA_ORIENTATION=-